MSKPDVPNRKQPSVPATTPPAQVLPGTAEIQPPKVNWGRLRRILEAQEKTTK